MSIKNRIARSVFKAIDEVNGFLPKEQQLDKTPDTCLLGGAGKLDSLGFVNLIVAIEANAMEDFGVELSLAEAGTNSLTASQVEGPREEDPFATVRTLIDYVSSLLEKRGVAE